MIRKAQAKDLPEIRDIEVAAGEAFRLLGMHAIAEDAPLSLDAWPRVVMKMDIPSS